MTARLRPCDDGFVVEGDLILAHVADLYARSRRLFDGSGPVRVDLAGVGHADSAGVALLVEWLRLARDRGASLELINVPRQMRAIIEVADLETVLPLAPA